MNRTLLGTEPIRRALTVFPGIDFELTGTEIRWTDGPTHDQVARAIDPLSILNLPELTRILSPDFLALLADDFEHWTGQTYDRDRRYCATFDNGRIVLRSDVLTSGDVLLRRLSQVTSVDGERCVWTVAS